MKAAIMQSSFLPWMGYFDLLDSVDVFYLYDDVAFTFKTWRNRNRIKTARGVEWISVPVQHETPRPVIDRARIAPDGNWAEKIQGKIAEAYRGAPHFRRYWSGIHQILAARHETISDLNEALLREVASMLGIRTEIRRTRAFGATATGEDRVFEIIERAGIHYLVNGPSAETYSNHDRYRQAGIGLAYMSYDYRLYPQLHGSFEPGMSVIDLLFNTGPEAYSYLKSRTAPREVVARSRP